MIRARSAWSLAFPIVMSLASSVSAQPAPASDDSINLVKLVGPAILKRAIPVAIALGGLVVLGRLLFRRRGKAETAEEA